MFELSQNWAHILVCELMESPVSLISFVFPQSALCFPHDMAYGRIAQLEKPSDLLVRKCLLLLKQIHQYIPVLPYLAVKVVAWSINGMTYISHVFLLFGSVGHTRIFSLFHVITTVES